MIDVVLIVLVAFILGVIAGLLIAISIDNSDKRSKYFK